jgi:hypothetical protein
MRAPETNDVLGCDPLYEAIKEKYPFATFSEAQWQEIRESLAERSVELGTEMVDELYGHANGGAGRITLRRSARCVTCCKKWPITPRWR